MTEPAPSGMEHLVACLSTLDDLCAQLLGRPEAAIASIRRSGMLAPPPPPMPGGETYEQREAAAEARIALLERLDARREKVVEAVGVLQDILTELAHAPSPAERLLAES
ncbi:MAG: hypothetical protein HY554_04205 [Elusimicrobia bacterium]|nr:hypothetical protein [Elusimicrobiota bacterium]